MNKVNIPFDAITFDIVNNKAGAITVQAKLSMQGKHLVSFPAKIVRRGESLTISDFTATINLEVGN